MWRGMPWTTKVTKLILGYNIKSGLLNDPAAFSSMPGALWAPNWFKSRQNRSQAGPNEPQTVSPIKVTIFLNSVSMFVADQSGY